MFPYTKTDLITTPLFFPLLEAVKMGTEHDDFVIGYVCQNNLTFDPKFIHMTPGELNWDTGMTLFISVNFSLNFIVNVSYFHFVNF